MQFSQIIGQKQLIGQLVETVKEDRIAHAQLFLGDIGFGGLPLAIAYATFVNCENKQEHDSCGVCNSCHKMAKLIHADLHFTYPTVSPAKLSRDFLDIWRETFLTNPYLNYQQWIQTLANDNKQGNITADESRDIIRRLSLKQLEGEYKIQIIWGVEYLGKEGNMLLKILEEPPEKTLFLLIGEDGDKILPTILSRAQMIRVHAIDKESLERNMVENANVNPQLARQVAALSNGSWNTAQSMTNNEVNDFLAMLKVFLNLSITRKNIPELFKTIDTLAQSGRESIKMFFEYFQLILQKSYIAHLTLQPVDGTDAMENEFINKMAQRLHVKNAEQLMKQLNKCSEYIERNANSKIVIFNLSLSVRNCLK
jgi:DNA polymerase-3 subunit delta'